MTRKSAQNSEIKVDFEQIVRNFAGIPLKMDDEPVTLKRLAVDALLGNYPNENLDGVEKALRYQLAKAVHGGKRGITAKERDMIRALIGRNFVPLLVGPAFEMLDAAPDRDEVSDAFDEVASDLAAVNGAAQGEHV